MPIAKPAFFCLTLLIPALAGAVGLGELRTLSRIGEPFRADIPIRLAPEERIGSDCFRLLPVPDSDFPSITSARLTISDKGEARLQIRGHAPVRDPLLAIRVEIACGGGIRRDYVALPQAPEDIAHSVESAPPAAGNARQLAVAGERRRAPGAEAPRPRAERVQARPRNAEAAAVPRTIARPSRDRLELGASNLIDSGLPPSIRSETEGRLLSLETSLNQLNESLARLESRLPTAAADALTLRQETRLTMAAPTQMTPPLPPPAVDAVSVAKTSRQWRQWLELVFGALLGGVLSAFAIQFVNRRLAPREDRLIS